MEYNFQDIESKWRQHWAENKTFRAADSSDKPKYYGLDMFPYPSGAGLHVGHPLGYIASDIYARFKRLKGFNVLHPMGYDSFGLPAEQYAIQTGQHPAITTEKNLARYREQLDKIGFSFDWDREVQTSSPDYYKWTQWIFKQLYNSWYNVDADKADDISNLEVVFENEGNATVKAETSQIDIFTAAEWNAFDEATQQKILMNYRLTYLADSMVNWCPALGTVLANDEIKDGVSERGGHPVVQKLMRQWSMRITAYSERLLNGLETIDWSDSIKEQQRNWIGKSVGAAVKFKVQSPRIGTVQDEKLVEQAKEMRANPTDAEAALWTELKGKKLGIKFRKQHLITDFIVDFVCLSKKLIVEIEKDHHGNEESIAKEKIQTKTLEDLGYKIIRLSDEEVVAHTEQVLKSISDALKSLPNQEEESNTNLEEIIGEEQFIEVFTTRPDTIFGVNFLVLAPEHALVAEITTDDQKEAVAAYQKQASLKTERDRQADVKNITGQFTGAYALHPFTGEKVQIWIGDYVLAGYGTGAVMAVPAGDQRDWDFAKHFDIEILNIFEGVDISEAAYAEKEGKMNNSGFLDGLSVRKAMKLAIYEMEKKGIGTGKTTYRLRDAVFSRQRYWGEPFPVYYKNDLPYLIEDDQLPVTLPEVDAYLPTEDGEPPLARAEKDAWNVFEGDRMEYNTMPGWAGSSWYFLRYMDPHNETEFVSKEKADYWNQVDLYIGGSEHATGHLLYSRFWTKFLKDKGFISFDEPFKKLINQGMILGRSSFVYRDKDSGKFVSFGKRKEYKTARLHADISLVDNDKLDLEGFKNWLPEYANAEFILEDDGTYICGSEVEKMSKSKYNVQTPDELVEKFGADTLRCYEMFLGPLEQAKPWDTKGINGVHNFLRKFWRLFHDAEGNFAIEAGEADKKALKTLHKTIKKIEDDLNRFSFNTGVSNFMIAVNELGEQNCNNKAILSDLVVLISPYAPHICEELWTKLGNEAGTLSYAEFPVFNPDFLVEANYAYPVSFNGKMRFKLELPTNMPKDEVEKAVLADEQSQKWLEGKAPKKMIVVPGKIVNVVV
ncbi:leucine--tRNA ligase [Putridiphycobacter roseus]|uniref:Leucine--tRNA ligase n=1 Tax=Putridiphycobacter roseus TaxID=2219161 RepID=A0A2W1NE13_9FLAO|nr:leucine--tRNA ligase [Putridiphycobacter roseus]PZE16306.1 leucine--tRNA ligase [Putridiphycobacter roseus]